MSEQKYISEISEIWELVKESFRSDLSESTTNLWFGDVKILSYKDDLITMGISSEFKFNKINSQRIS